MLIKHSQLAGLAVVTKSQLYLGALKNAVVDPDTGLILAYRLKKSGANCLSPLDILSWHGDFVQVKNDAELHLSHELWRVEKLLRDKRALLKTKVFTQSGEFVGICNDLDLNPEQGIVHQLEVVKSYLSIFPTHRRLISPANIIEVTRRQITVKDSTLKLPLFATQPLNRNRAIAA